MKRFAVIPIFVAMTMANSCFAAALPDVYREARTALANGDAAKAVALLEPVLASQEGDETQRTLINLALGMAYLRTGKAEAALPLLEKAGARFAGTPEAANAF